MSASRRGHARRAAAAVAVILVASAPSASGVRIPADGDTYAPITPSKPAAFGIRMASYGLAVSFRAVAPWSLPIRSVSWFLGDGANGWGWHVVHTYSRAGEFRVVAFAVDTAGRTYTASVTVHVAS